MYVMQHIDCFMHLLNAQLVKHENRYVYSRWTCMNSLYNQLLEYGVKKFQTLRETQKQAGDPVGKDVDWGTVDPDLYFYAAGFNESWGNKAWSLVDDVYGVDNIKKKHWFAYRYDIRNRTVVIYDSAKSIFKEDRSEIAQRHATLAPSLYNVNISKEEDKLDPDEPFVMKIMEDVPQQTNGYDCGVYACKIIQCLTMRDH